MKILSITLRLLPIFIIFYLPIINMDMEWYQFILYIFFIGAFINYAYWKVKKAYDDYLDRNDIWKEIKKAAKEKGIDSFNKNFNKNMG